MNKGWLKLHRELMDKPIWTCSTSQQKVVLMAMLMMVNFEARQWEWKGETYSVQPGQFVTSLATLAERCGKDISVQNVRSALNRFAKYGFLTNESTMRSRLITIVNWEFYQQNESVVTKQPTNNQQSANKELTTTKNYKKEKNERIKPFLQKKQVNEFKLDLTKGEAL